MSTQLDTTASVNHFVRDAIARAIAVVALGRLPEGRIAAEKPLVKCPSKYQGAEV